MEYIEERLSFSKKTRLEALDNFKFLKNDCCNISFLEGVMFAFYENLISQDLEKVLKSVRKLLRKYNINSEILSTKLGFILEIYDFEDLEELIKKNNHCERCISFFITGFFISKAIITDPEKVYSLEFILKDKEKADIILEKMQELDFNLKLSKRNNSYVVYTKQSEIIEEILALVGAQNACLEIMSGKVMRDISNKINRIENCTNANFEKINLANEKYTSAINKLIEENKFIILSDELKYIAELKLENPELSLLELGNIAEPPLSKSAVNRRMQKLIQLADNK